MDNELIRINKYLAEEGIATRREADKLIEQGKIFINGKRAILGQKIGPDDNVEIKNFKQKVFNYYAYYKPRGVITHSPQKGEKDIAGSINMKGVFPIGRLDKDSEGLIILTNDGRITERLLGPDFEHEKEYLVKTRIPVRLFHTSVMEKGMDIGNGERTKPCQVKQLSEDSFRITLTEGKKHQIRRMCDALNIPIDSLKRVRIMNIRIGGLKSNQYRKIEGEELDEFLANLGL